MIDQPATLNRTLSFWQLTFYGVGTILGAGIYVLIGEVAAVAGMWTPLSFIMAALLAALTGLSFAELSSRFPLSAGEAVYVKQGLNSI
jgi:APA family basic amino acid/polyamine antiporter